MKRQRPRKGFFTTRELERLKAGRGKVALDQGVILYCVYENPFAKSGGVSAVAHNYGAELIDRKEKVVILSPYHKRLKSKPVAAETEKVANCKVTFDDRSYTVELHEHYDDSKVRWVLLRAKGFFEGDGGPSQTDPYIYSASKDKDRLLEDSLFLCAAIPHAAKALGFAEDIVVHLQDWELASTALTVKEALLKGRLKSATVVLTSHNPYDHELPRASLRALTERADRLTKKGLETVYQSMIPLMDAPVSTVSETFAEELTKDPLQTTYFANHLQDVFKKRGLIGIDNGLFGEAVPPYVDTSPKKVLAAKLAKRKEMLAILEGYEDDRILGHLDGGDDAPLSDLEENVPVFMMFGRLDPRQKGFDVFARAIERFPKGAARFVITPIVGGAPESFVKDFKDLAKARPGEVAVYPFRMERGYLETMAGATYAVMPSFYEPFGAATEPYLMGTPVVARATGGLVGQVVDVDDNPGKGTGILFQEKVSAKTDLGSEWKQVMDAKTPADRTDVVLYKSMVDALVGALERAGEIYQNEDLYAGTLANLFERACLFSWDKAAREYDKWYKRAISG